MHGGATATLVDLVGSAAIFTVGAPSVGVSVEINVSYLDAAFGGVKFLDFCDWKAQRNDIWISGDVWIINSFSYRNSVVAQFF